MKAFLKSLFSVVKEGAISLLNSIQIQALLEQYLLKLLKSQALGGVRGWLLKTLVREFSEEVIEVVSDTIDYIEIKKKAIGTIGMEDRDEATTTLNDIMR